MVKIRVAVIGSGNIGADLGEKLLLDERFELFAMVGRNSLSSGLSRFKNRAKLVFSNGFDDLAEHFNDFDGIFDATSAFSHSEHWDFCQNQGKWVIDLTPSKIGIPLVPALIGGSSGMTLHSDYVANYSMITCGGQSSAPMINAFSENADGITAVEISSSIASLSAGPATRLNIDQYIDTTENLARLITKCENTKAILVLNPSEPPVMMRTTVTVKAKSFNLNEIEKNLSAIESKVQRYVPGYSVVVKPHLINHDTVVATAKVTGAGHFLPAYAGNLDIINSAALETAKLHFDNFNMLNGLD